MHYISLNDVMCELLMMLCNNGALFNFRFTNTIYTMNAQMALNSCGYMLLQTLIRASAHVSDVHLAARQRDQVHNTHCT